MINIMKSINYDNIIKNKDEEAAELFYYLLKHFSYRSYNPKGNYCVVAFTICDESINDKLSEFLYNHEFYKIER